MDMYSFATYGLNPECTGIIPTNTPAEIYWNHRAYYEEKAWELIRKLDINFPLFLDEGSPAIVFARSIMRPLYHLVIRGEDTNANITLLLGPTWKEASTRRWHLICRLLVLMDPEEGSVPFRAAEVFRDAMPTVEKMTKHMEETTDVIKKWSPRAASEPEGVLLRRIKWGKSEHGFKAAPAPPVRFKDGLTDVQKWKLEMDRVAAAFFREIGMV